MDGGFGRLLIVAGLIIALVGVVIVVGGRLGLGRLPGDFVLGGGNFRIYLPIASSILVSVAVSLVLWFFNR